MILFLLLVGFLVPCAIYVEAHLEWRKVDRRRRAERLRQREAMKGRGSRIEGAQPGIETGAPTSDEPSSEQASER